MEYSEDEIIELMPEVGIALKKIKDEYADTRWIYYTEIFTKLRFTFKKPEKELLTGILVSNKGDLIIRNELNWIHITRRIKNIKTELTEEDKDLGLKKLKIGLLSIIDLIDTRLLEKS